MINIIDAFQDFKEGFKGNLDLSVEDKIELWEQIYNEKYPELINKLKDDYTNDGYEWYEIAQTRVFNRTKNDFSKMVQAYDNIKSIILDIDNKAMDLFNLDLEVNIVLYAGLCNSAGWVDEYKNEKAILYGIDKIAELEWHTIDEIESLLCHELCHVIHDHMRDKEKIIDEYDNNYKYGIWRLYVEGVAQYYQSKLMNEEKESRGKEWLNSCNEKINELKKLFLEALHDEEKGTNDFFGDWFKVLGISDAGYYLGQEFIRNLSSSYSFNEIAILEIKDIEEKLMLFLNN